LNRGLFAINSRLEPFASIFRPGKCIDGQVHHAGRRRGALKIINVDTDMIIPKQYLKTIKRTGLGKGLFSEQRYKDDGSENPDFILNKPAYRKPRCWSPATISAAARAASTRPGRCSISASAA
jgi:3-isopropylmalate/(R)-2-methylmalate dehydratase small subunit